MKSVFRVFLAGMFLVIGGGLSLVSATELSTFDINFQVQLETMSQCRWAQQSR